MEDEEYIMIYKIMKNKKNIRILGENFVRNNKNKGKIIHKNKIYPLLELFQLKDFTNNKLKIRLLLKNCCNKSCMFKDCSSLIKFTFKYNLGNKNDEILKNGNNNLFIGPNKNKENAKLNIKWNGNISALNEMFSNCPLLKTIPDISNWNTSKIIDMSRIFYNCRNLSIIPDISKWDTSNVIDMNRMFYNCASLKSLPDISKWDTENVFNMNKMFYNCLFLSSIPDISKKKMKNMNMNSLFEKSYSIFKLIYEMKNETVITYF